MDARYASDVSCNLVKGRYIAFQELYSVKDGHNSDIALGGGVMEDRGRKRPLAAGSSFDTGENTFGAPAGIRSESSHKDARAANGNATVKEKKVKVGGTGSDLEIFLIRQRAANPRRPAPTAEIIPVPLVASYAVWH
jgi:hypothetical protein